MSRSGVQPQPEQCWPLPGIGSGFTLLHGRRGYGIRHATTVARLKNYLNDEVAKKARKAAEAAGVSTGKFLIHYFKDCGYDARPWRYSRNQQRQGVFESRGPGRHRLDRRLTGHESWRNIQQ